MNRARKRIPYGTKLPVYFTQRELKDIRDHAFADPDFGRIAVVRGRLRLDLSLDDIEDVQGYIAAEANHTDDAKLKRQLDKLFDKLQTFLDEYDDQSKE